MGMQGARLDIENPSGAVTASSNVATVRTKADAAHNILMRESVSQVDVQNATNARVENGEPVLAFSLVSFWNSLDVQISKAIPDLGHQGVKISVIGRRRLDSRAGFLSACNCPVFSILRGPSNLGWYGNLVFLVMMIAYVSLEALFVFESYAAPWAAAFFTEY